MAAYGKELNTAEIAYAAIDEVTLAFVASNHSAHYNKNVTAPVST